MNVVWDGDTGTITVTATANGTAVNLTGSTARHLKVRNKATDVVTELSISSTDLPNGKVTAIAQSLDAGNYDVILRLTDTGGAIVTYPSADVGAARLKVVADIDA